MEVLLTVSVSKNNGALTARYHAGLMGANVGKASSDILGTANENQCLILELLEVL